MKNLFLFSLMMLSSAVTAVADMGDGYAGLCGASLKSAVGRGMIPSHPCVGIYGTGGLWEAFRLTDSDGSSYGVADLFGGGQHTFPADGVSNPVDMSLWYVVPPEWWFNDAAMGAAVSLDLYNVMPCDLDVVSRRDDWAVPGSLEVVNSRIGNISIGLSGSIAAWEPADELKGDVARVIFYMATLYPCTLWHGTAYNFFVDNEYPTLNRRAVELMLQWHKSDPVSERERHRVDAVASVQGNRNLFVDMPWLVDYIWGDKRETPYVGGVVNPDTPDNPDTPSDADTDVDDNPVPLRGRYGLDDKIWLRSPFVPDGARWTIDGVAVNGDSVTASSLGLGCHEIGFETTGRHGVVTIIVE
ncbi:MAG: endonuclease [Pseudoflavonifractor sp.]|nr:endonuclease [Pseudoflavonifractor sp.]